ncbi:YihY/virulence factor BrkB family protein [Cellulomonas fimi]|uniref:YihY/virulence factor BrkB family protein n=1 Tax=Cellulomonas fimi TaxID=1708 RepID=A0A7Y0LZV1_CELFI|nr:YihY/virulence factor BrkB family protein [Cellulomonas fimi]NMR19822.1 YihY/virulence factor BrkB family protein [Cellulomonas fimi]
MVDDRTDTSRKAQQAPDPEDPRKPDDPTDLKKPSWKYAFRKAVREFSADECTDLAAALTYYAVLALFPAILAIVSLLSLVGDPAKTADAMLQMAGDLGPEDVIATLQDPIESLTQAPAAGLAFVIGLAGALWSASGYVGAFGRAMNRVYEIEEGRPFWKLRPVMILVTLVSVILIAVIAFSLVLSGPVAESIGDLIGLGGTAVTVWNIAKWPVLLALVIFVVALLYYATPNVRQPKFRWMSLGALLAIVTALVASALFGLYVANFGKYSETYGSLAGVIVFLLWLWIINLALLFGAEFDAELERGRQLQAGIAAEETIQLPPRDDRKSKKDAAKEAEDVKRGREIRESAAAEQKEQEQERDRRPGGR